jgi:protease I
MADELNGKKIAFLTANEGVEEVELTEPLKAVTKAGARTEWWTRKWSSTRAW